MVFLCTVSVEAGVPDSSHERYISKTVDIAVTPLLVTQLEQRAKGTPPDAEARRILAEIPRKTVFWTGRVSNFSNNGQECRFTLTTGNNRAIRVQAKSSVRNLDFDRTGFIVGIKGNPVVENHTLSYLLARSAVLIEPPDHMSYENFMRVRNISDEFTLNTSPEPVTIRHLYYPFLVHRIYIHNPHYSLERIQNIAKSIVYFSCRYPMDPLLVGALINVESAYDIDAVSSAGALGLGQLMPCTARGLGVNPHDPFQNVGGSVRYLHRQMKRWEHHRDQISLALACYNAGPGAVDRYGGVPPFSETRNYIYFITLLHREYSRQFEQGTARLMQKVSTVDAPVPGISMLPESREPEFREESCVDY